MTKNHVLTIVAAVLLGAFWVYPNVERSQGPTRLPTSVNAPVPVDPPVSQPIHRKKTHIKPMKVKKTVAARAKVKRGKIAYSKRVRSLNFDKADRRPTSLPTKKSRPKRDTLATRSS